MFFDYMNEFRSGEKIAMKKSIYIPGVLEDHRHNFFEIAYITSGNGYHILNGQSHAISKGDLLLLTERCTHNITPDKTGRLEWMNCMFLPEVIDEQLFQLANTTQLLESLIFSNPMYFDSSNLSDIELHNNIENLNMIFYDMNREYLAAKAGYQETLKCYLKILLIKIFRACYTPVHQWNISSNNNSLIKIVLDYLKENSSLHSINIEELAKKTFYSPRYFQNLFKKQTGMSLGTFIRNYKIDMAQQLLKSTDLSIQQIMEQINMNDSKNFYAFFKAETGMTPAQFRQVYGDENEK